MKIKVLVFVLFAFNLFFGKGVVVSNISLSNVSGEYVTINYNLNRTSPTISSSQPVWIFIKYKEASETNYTGWKDTDDTNSNNDASDDNDASRINSVNANLSGDVNIVSQGGSNSILWHWAGEGGIGNGTGLLSTSHVLVRIYAIEMAHIGGGNVDFRQDSGFLDRSLTGTTTKCDSDFYMMKYPVTAEMYKDFLNVAANRHDNPSAIDSVYDFYTQNSYRSSTGPRHMLYSQDNDYGLLSISGTVGTNAVWSIYDGDGNGVERSKRAMTHITWFNAYDFSEWCGLSLLEEEHYYKVSSENGQSIRYWGDSSPLTSYCNFFDSQINRPSDVTQNEDAVDLIDGGPMYGVYELAGNIWEWTSTSANGYNPWEASFPYDSTKGPMLYNTSSTQMIKKGGGRWFNTADQIYSARRYFGNTIQRYEPSGFRCGYFGGAQ